MQKQDETAKEMAQLREDVMSALTEILKQRAGDMPSGKSKDV